MINRKTDWKAAAESTAIMLLITATIPLSIMLTLFGISILSIIALEILH